MKKLRVTVEGKTYDVTVELLGDTVAAAGAQAPAERPYSPPTPAAARAAAAVPVHGADTGGRETGDVPSPLSGKIVAIDVQVGQTVQAGDQLATVEAMKMNTSVPAPAGGKVTRILASAGDQIEEGQAILTIQ